MLVSSLAMYVGYKRLMHALKHILTQTAAVQCSSYGLCKRVVQQSYSWCYWVACRLRDSILAAAKVALERMEAGRKVFLKGRALALAQRMALYARDELNMSTLRIRVYSLCLETVWSGHALFFGFHILLLPAFCVWGPLSVYRLLHTA